MLGQQENRKARRTRIEDLPTIGNELSEADLRSVLGGVGRGGRTRSDVTFEGIEINGGCGTTVDHDAKECDE